MPIHFRVGCRSQVRRHFRLGPVYFPARKAGLFMSVADDTICAIGTAAGGAARGMVRVSGQDAVAVAGRLFEAADGRALDSVGVATAVPGQVRIEVDSALRRVPCDLFLWPTDRSYTREPVAEVHTIGSRPVLESLLRAVCRAGARLAEPGEFTLRAFLAGRLDLTQAEAVLGVIDARGGDELDAALTQLAGGLARPLHRLREDLLQMLAELEAGLDFVEEDIEFISADEMLEGLRSAIELLDGVGRQMASRHVASDAPRIALIGPPNVGKSSLFNTLVRLHGCSAAANSAAHTPALVSPQKGTTRDYLTAQISLNGMRCELIDTAGVDGGSLPSSIDAAAQAIAVEQRERADIRAYCIEANHARTSVVRDCDLIIRTKADLAACTRQGIDASSNLPVVLTSSRTLEGLDRLCDAFRTILTDQVARRPHQVVANTADRCRESIRLARQSLDAAAQTIQNNGGSELVAIELRAALGELGKVVGAVYTDDLLDRIFSTFCIGK
jgi:tRNA modification GTPase